MKRPTVKRRTASNGMRKAAGTRHLPLDRQARELLRRTARVLAHCGHSREDLLKEFDAAVAAIPDNLKRLSADCERETLDAPHLLTLWHSERAFVDDQGVPRPLRRKGKRFSIETLCRRARRGLNVNRTLRLLLRSGAVQERDGWYRPAKRSVVFHGIAGPSAFHNVRGAAAMLSTAEHNLTERDPWFERIVENPRFPVSQVPAFKAFLEVEGLGFLGRTDEFMHECERSRKRREPTVRLGVGVFRFQSERRRK